MDIIDEIILKSIKNKTVSGEYLSKITGISRTAVWKRIKKLEKSGYKISHSHEGYRLLNETPYLIPFEIKKCLKTEKIGKTYVFFFEIDSTNKYGKLNEFPDGTVILAESQTKGKGRKGRKWISSKGKGLYFSIVLKRDYPAKDIMKLSLLFPLSVKKALQSYVKKSIKIKWPNDLYINNKKFAGFLIETEIEGSDICKIIAGIGININNSSEEFGEIKEKATSLKIEEGKELDRKKIFCSILESIEHHLKQFGNFNLTKEIEKDLLWRGERVVIVDEGIEGILVGLDESGGIKISKGKEIITIYSGDLSLRRIN